MSRNYSNNPFTNLFNEFEKHLIANTKNHYFATVSSVSDSGISISIDGDTSGVKKYTCNRGASFSPGDRVLVAKESGTYVVICKIGKPGKLAKKTSAMTQPVGADSDGGLWTTPAESKVKPVTKTSAMTQPVGIDASGQLWTTPPTEAESYNLPVATSTKLGGVKPVTKTSSMSQEVGVDAAGQLWTAPPGAAKVTTLYSSTTSVIADTVTLSTAGILTPGKFSRSSRIGLGTNSYWFGDCYLGGYGATRIGNETYYSTLGFFGETPIKQPTLSTASSNMGYTSATESNHLTILNNVVGILKKYGLIS